MSSPYLCRWALVAPPPHKYQFHPQEATFHLSRALSFFTKQVDCLVDAYSKLQEKWLSVNEELTQKIVELEHLTQHILGHISQGILWLRLDGTLQYINPVARLYLGLSNELVKGKRIDHILSSDMLGFSLKEALTFGLVPKITYKSLHKRTLEIATFFVYEGAKTDHGLVILLKDIGPMEQLQLSLSRNERLNKLGEMLCTVAHEIRNPLGGIRGYASLLVRDLKGSPHLEEMAQFIVEGTKQLDTLVSSVLQYARPVQMQIRPIDLGQFLRQWVKELKVDPAFPANVQLQLHTPFSSCILSIDPDRIKSALLNLAFNAIQAMPTGGLLRIALWQRDKQCLIEIADTGIGMAEEELKQLFSPFYTTKQKGNGLGLVEVQKIVQAHFGSIEVRSQPKRGSTFTVTLPLTREKNDS